MTQCGPKQICGCMRVIYANFRWLSRSQRNIVPPVAQARPSVSLGKDQIKGKPDAREGHMAIPIRRRELVLVLGGIAAAWPLAARAQQSATPVVGLVNARSPEASERQVAAFRKGLNEAGCVEGQNMTVEYHWLNGQYDRLPSLMADLVRRVAVIATPGATLPALAAKAATATVPIVFGVAEDPVGLGLVASFARPGGNATGINIFLNELVAKRLGLLHELVPKAVRVAVLVNPANAPSAETTLREIPEAAHAIGLQTQVLNASTSREIEAAFATLVRERADALFRPLTRSSS